MAAKKIFIGPKLREFRRSRELTQSQLATELGVSTSYINLMERNQRTASLNFLITLSDRFGLDWREFSNDKADSSLSDLRQITKDPAFGDTLPDIEELRGALEVAPNLINGIFNIYAAYQTYGERLAEQSEAIAAGDPEFDIGQCVHDFFRGQNNYFDELERCAEKCHADGIADRQEMYGSLRAHLQGKLGIRVETSRSDVLGNTLRSYDPDKKTIFLSEGLDHNNKVFQLAHMIALIGFPDVITSQIPEYIRKKPRASALCRVELANYFAAALMMPYDEFHGEAKATNYDIDCLAVRFSVSYEQVCHRLPTLQRPGSRGIPFFFLRIDRAGNVGKRINATPIQLARYGGACPRLDVHYSFRVPGRILTQVVEMPDNSRYLTINRTVDRPSMTYSTEDKRQAVSLGCSLQHAKDTIYGQHLEARAGVGSGAGVTQIGVNCRLCPRKHCHQRAHNPFFLDLQLDENKRGVTSFES